MAQSASESQESLYGTNIAENEENGNTENAVSAQKQRQFEIIQENNPAPNDQLTWIRSADEIKTLQEALADPEYAGDDSFTPDWTRAQAEDAIQQDSFTVYSSTPIRPGSFVTPSRMEAQGYSGGVQLFSETVSPSDVAWIDVIEGQYAPAEQVRYSISPELDSDLDDVLDGTFPKTTDEVYLGETSQFLVNDIGAQALPLYMPPAKAYSAMVSRAEWERTHYYREQENYHNLGKQKFMEILDASENPIAAFAAPPDEEGNKRENRIVLVTDIKIDGKYAVVVEEVNTNALRGGRLLRANKAITAYDRETIKSDLNNAADDHRLLHLDKKRSQDLTNGVQGSTPQASTRASDFKNNIRDFWANVNWKDSGRSSYTQPQNQATQTKSPMQIAYEEAQARKQAESKQRFSVAEEDEEGRIATEPAAPRNDREGIDTTAAVREQAEKWTIQQLENRLKTDRKQQEQYDYLRASGKMTSQNKTAAIGLAPDRGSFQVLRQLRPPGGGIGEAMKQLDVRRIALDLGEAAGHGPIQPQGPCQELGQIAAGDGHRRRMIAVVIGLHCKAPVRIGDIERASLIPREGDLHGKSFLGRLRGSAGKPLPKGGDPCFVGHFTCLLSYSRQIITHMPQKRNTKMSNFKPIF